MNRYIITSLAFLVSITTAHADQVLKGRPGADQVIVWSTPDAADVQSGMPWALRDDIACVVPAGVKIERLPLSNNRTLNDAFKPVPVEILDGYACRGYVELKDLRVNG